MSILMNISFQSYILGGKVGEEGYSEAELLRRKRKKTDRLSFPTSASDNEEDQDPKYKSGSTRWETQSIAKDLKSRDCQ